MKKPATRRKAKAVDIDNPEWTAADARRARPTSEVLPDLIAAVKRARGRPKSNSTKMLISLRLDRQIVDAFKAQGDGWQSRMNETLAKAVKRLKADARS